MTKRLYPLIIILIFSFSGQLYAAASATITNHSDGDSFKTGENITFNGEAEDTDGNTVAGDSLKWTFSNPTETKTGGSVSISFLNEGENITVTLTAFNDEDNVIASDYININITNPVPEVTIDSPADNSEISINDDINFSGTATDEQDGNLDGSSLQWTSSKDGVIGTGKSFTSSSLQTGVHEIKLTATDEHGGSASDIITIEIINNKPVAEILLPQEDDETFSSGDTISFQGRGEDEEDDEIQNDTLRWVSSKNGFLGSGPEIVTNDLDPGDHIITLTVEDSNGLISDPVTRTLTVTNDGPTTSIDSPSDDDVFEEGAVITFSGSATDPEDGNLTGASLVWSSNKDGEIGTGKEIKESNLSHGPHTITLTATDNDGLSSSESISITAGNKLPVPEILSPSNNEIFEENDNVDFSGKATDYEDGSLGGDDLVWTSSRDGEIGTGTTFTSSSLTSGQHFITLTATDSYGASYSDEISIIYGNIPPEAEIHTPGEDGAEYESGEDVFFHGTGTDTDDGDLTGNSLEWISNRNGDITVIGTGTSFKVNNLKSGEHLITLKATDSGGSTGEALRRITIREMFPDKDVINIQENNSDTFEITGGIEPFSVYSRRADIASASVSGRTVSVNGGLAGESEIIVTDRDSINSFSVYAKITKDAVSVPRASAILTKDGYQRLVFTEGDRVTADGSDSYDENEEINSWKWEFASGPVPVYFDNPQSRTANFIVPPVYGNQKFKIRLYAENTQGVKDFDEIEFTAKEKNDPFDMDTDAVPVKAGDTEKYMGVKYLKGLTRADSVKPGSDERNRPESLPYDLLDLEMQTDDFSKTPASSATRQIASAGQTAQFIVYLPEKAGSEYSWFQENTQKGWQDLLKASSPETEGAYFNYERDQVFINIKDNGIYDLDGNTGSVRTVSGLGSKVSQTSEQQSSSSSSSGGGCFINSLF